MIRAGACASIALLVSQFALAQAPPDCSAAEHRQFDFWIGEFVVQTPDGKLAGHNTIAETLAGCALTEHWRGAGGGEGRSINFFDRGDKRWHQLWIDSNGRPLRLSGRLTDESMVLEGSTTGRDGKAVLQRVTWIPLADHSVRQHWESSTDDGASWATVFDGIYRKTPENGQ